ncbi:MAG: hypothetical protein LBH61_05145 [Dysgonamonadaceae bacterium]|jgi:hypothetical protein|nr:hypothetical protein [Dysgonamonadaceae bacterium]
MKRSLFFLIAILSLFSIHAQNPGWKEAAALEEQSLPQSALEAVNRIYQSALATGNSPELIKAIIYQLKYETAIDREKLPEQIVEVESVAASGTDPVQQAMLYSLLAELYVKYYQANSYEINQRTATAGPAPADIREWPGNLFFQKAIDLTALSLAPAEALQQTNTTDYKEVLTGNEASQNLQPTLFDFLLYKGIRLLDELNGNYYAQHYFPKDWLSGESGFAPAKEFIRLRQPADTSALTGRILDLYRQLLAFRLKENNPEALLSADLSRLDFVKNNTQSDKAGTAYLEALHRLKREAGPLCAEVLYKEAAYYFDNSRNEETATESIRKAYETCTAGIAGYPAYERIGLLQNLLHQITQSTLSVTSDNAVYPGNDLTLKVNYRNFHKLTVEVYRINAPASASFYNDEGLYRTAGTPVVKKEVELVNTFPYLYSDTTLRIPVKDNGLYEYVVYAGGGEEERVHRPFSVSRLATLARSVGPQWEFLVVDRLTGKPVEGAQVNLYKRNNNVLVRTNNNPVKTDRQGLAAVPYNREVTFYHAAFEKDTALAVSPVPWVSSHRFAEAPDSRRLTLFTDRSLYRPGQTVYFKGIAAVLTADDQQVLPGKTYTLTLRDANAKEIARKTFVTNDFGSISGEFILPPGGLAGVFLLQSDNDEGYVSFRVEEYRRPLFDIRFDHPDESYAFGDEVTVKGVAETFSGIRLQEAAVKYRVTRQPHWRFPGIRRAQVQVAEGEIKTSGAGTFEIRFPAEKAFEDRDRKDIFSIYTVETTVTGASGETQSARTAVYIGDRSLYLSMDGLTGVLDKHQLPEIKINALDLSGVPVPALRGRYELYPLTAKGGLQPDRQEDDWVPGKRVLSDDFVAGQTLALTGWKQLPSGRYRILLKATDDKGRPVEMQQDFTLAAAGDKRPPVPTCQWLMTPKTTCAVGESAEIIYGTSARNVYILYELFKEDKKLSASRFVLNNENRKIIVPFLESYADGITATFTFVKDNKAFTENVVIRRKQPDKRLHLKTEVFRDRLTPGQTEEWTVSIEDAARQPADAELLTSMYDASLDKILPHSWDFRPVREKSISLISNRPGNEFNPSYDSFQSPVAEVKVPAYGDISFNWFGFHVISPNAVLRNRMLFSRSDAAAENAPALPEMAKQADGAPNPPEVEVRRNFNETAFFYPQLTTNGAGETRVSFTVPESNTTWKWMSLAHTRDLKYGQLVQEAISRKQLMVTPNIPRFVRQGDRTTIAAGISNLTEETISGKATLVFFDPATGERLIDVANPSQAFAVEAGQTVVVDWSFEVPAGLDGTGVRVVAQSAAFSDGEQHLIPVLPNRMMVTESIPLDVQEGQTRTFAFDKWTRHASPTLENYRLTLEIAGNPVWYAVQALPALSAPQSDNALSWFAAWYSNEWATRLANSTPKIKQVVDAWSRQGGTTETLLSHLGKNPELKALLLEETPWVMEAGAESEQMQRLALLFDVNRSANLRTQALLKLESLQNEDGGWPWFNGMQSSVSITQWILYAMKELPASTELQAMQAKAVRFIDLRFKQYADAENRAGRKAPEHFSTYELEYLFVRSLYPELPPEENRAAIAFYTGIVEKRWQKSGLYHCALAASLMQRNGNARTAQAILKSLREHAVRKPDLGMYWPNNSLNSFMTQSAVCVHTFIMDAFLEAGAGRAEMDEMKRWLLKQKQTLQWESVPATVSAIRMLLKSGTNWLESEGDVRITAGNKTIDTSRKEAGTGYFKESWNAAADIFSSLHPVTLSKSGAGPAWGALYWQYWEDIDKISSARTGLSVEKALFIERVTAGGKSLAPVTESNPLKTGDKATVRLTVRSDRDMEYVLLKDLRASCFEPVQSLSGTQWQQGVSYYLSPRDASMNFFFPVLPKGTYVFEYDLYVTRQGSYSNGAATVQCLYAPAFVSHTAGGRVEVK